MEMRDEREMRLEQGLVMASSSVIECCVSVMLWSVPLAEGGGEGLVCHAAAKAAAAA